MLRPDIQPEQFHQRQIGTLPDRYGLRVTEIAEGRMQMQMELQPWMMAPNGFLHASSFRPAGGRIFPKAGMCMGP